MTHAAKMGTPNSIDPRRVTRGRLTLIALVLFFTLPVIAAKAILVKQWYNSGVTNQGTLIEPLTTFESLGVANPFQHKQWQLGYVVPSECEARCQQQIHLLGQTHIALGKYQERVTPVLLRTDQSAPLLEEGALTSIAINDAFHQVVGDFEYVIIDPLGQLVMRYPPEQDLAQLPAQSKGLLADLRKLLKLSRVG